MRCGVTTGGRFVARIIRVSKHALEQFYARWPQDISVEAAGQLIVQEVASALDEGRYSSKEPRWAQRSPSYRATGRRNGQERDRTLRYVWVEDHTRIYLVDKSGEVTYVVTAIAPSADTLNP